MQTSGMASQLSLPRKCQTLKRKSRVEEQHDFYQDDHGARDESEVVRHEEGVVEEDFIEVPADGPELFPARGHGLELAERRNVPDLLLDRDLGRVEDRLQRHLLMKTKV